MTENLVYQYVWRDHSLPPSKGLLLTLGDNQAILLIAFVTILTAFTQTRSWAAARSLLFAHAMPPVQLNVLNHPAKTLSQLGAVGSLVRPHKVTPIGEIHHIPPIFGVLAIANALVFLALGVILPWSLVGGNETPLVKSRKTDTCVGLEMRNEAPIKTANLADSFFKQCWYSLTDTLTPCDRMEEISSFRLPLHISRESECPFPGNVCQNETQSLHLEHQYISPRLVGINSKSYVRVGHQLTCAPLKIEHFLSKTTSSDIRSILNFGNLTGLQGNPEKMGSYGTILGTLNGPNYLSTEKSGRQAALDNRPYDLRIFPSEEERNATERIYSIHADLRREDATVFVIVLQLGRSYYTEPIDDPFFAAHDFNKVELVNGTYYYPDHEATAMGCAEQYQICFGDHPDLCTAWQAIDVGYWDMIALYASLYAVGDVDSANDVFPVIAKLIRTVSVHRYLLARRGTKALLASLWRQSEVITNIDRKEQWVHELKAWFETSILMARFGFLEMVKRTTTPSQDEVDASKSFLFINGICGRVLFRSGNYSNFYFVWLIVAISAQVLLSVLSYAETYTALNYAAIGMKTLSFGIFTLAKKAVGSFRRQSSALSNRLHHSLILPLNARASNIKTRATQILNRWVEKIKNVTLIPLPGFGNGFGARTRTSTPNSNSGLGSRARRVNRTGQPNQPQRPPPALDPGRDVDLTDL